MHHLRIFTAIGVLFTLGSGALHAQTFAPLGEEFKNCGQPLGRINQTTSCFKDANDSGNLYILPFLVFDADNDGRLIAEVEDAIDGSGNSRVVLHLLNSPVSLIQQMVPFIAKSALAQKQTQYASIDTSRIQAPFLRRLTSVPLERAPVFTTIGISDIRDARFDVFSNWMPQGAANDLQKKLVLWPFVDPLRPMSSWRSAWRTLRKEAAKGDKEQGREAMPRLANLRFYDLRHQVITEMLKAGIPEGVIREVAGHVDPAMTRHYSHPRLAARRDAVAVLGTFQTLSKAG